MSWQAPPEYQGLAGVPLEFLPFPAALTDPAGIVAVNPLWHAEQPSAAPGQNMRQWCTLLHPSNAELEPEFSAGLGGCARRKNHPLRRKTSVQPRHAGESRSHPPGRASWCCSMISAAATCRIELDLERGAQARKMETVGRLVSGVAHDFANLLTLISGYSDLRAEPRRRKGPSPRRDGGDPQGRQPRRSADFPVTRIHAKRGGANQSRSTLTP